MKAFQSQYGSAFATKGGKPVIVEEEDANYSEDDFEESDGDDEDSDNNDVMAGCSGSTGFNTSQRQAMETSHANQVSEL